MYSLTKRIGVILISFALLLVWQLAAYATFPGKNGRIAFGRFDPNVGDLALFTANPDGTDVRQLTFVPSLFSDWRADGQRIAFAFIDSDGNEQVATIKPDGSDFQQITSGPSIHEVGSWSPTGNQIVFTYSAQAFDDPAFTTSLYFMNSDGSNPHPVMNAAVAGFDVEPRWSPDGTRIVFSRIRKMAGNGFQQEAIFVINADGSNLRQLTAWGLAEEHPGWSPDSQWIIFNVAKESPVHLSGGNNGIYLIRPDGSEKHLLYNGRAGGQSGVPTHKPVFSPDGTKILFGCWSRAIGSNDICTMNVDGTNVVDITNNPLDENFPSWGPSELGLNTGQVVHHSWTDDPASQS